MKKNGIEKSVRRARAGAVLLAVAVLIGVLLTFMPDRFFPSPHRAEEVVEETPNVIYIPARPSVAPTPTPTINLLKVSAAGAELTEDGFTTYVGDRAVTLSVLIEPQMAHPPVSWSVSDPESASLTISDDRMSCKYNALKPSGKNELTVSCYGAEVTFPVYLWKR